MNVKLALSGLLSAALLSGCGSAPKLSEPEGQWEDMPFTHKPAPSQIQPAASPAPQAQPLKTTSPKRPASASPAKPAEAPPNDSKCSAN
ncbi:conjugal transfer protein [Pseudomonas syringae group genomosp. 3]|uniref:conjugal transfer protein n=1 Tax=Pseudomonas syringae group genomosp. 3 TaxID=251701 RepID=UPI000F00B131|nr:conjugal transfer protein [Pseudomonas syringae group genomosp. 3]